MSHPIDRTPRPLLAAPGALAADPATDPAIDAVLAGVAERLATRGMRAALAYLNARTRFRYTGLYRAEPPALRNIELFDRENPTLNLSGNLCALDDTYCAIVCATDRPFRAADAGHDRRLLRHPARESIISYFGVPVRADGGRVVGTLCHFDVRPRIAPAAELPLLERVAVLLAPLVAASGRTS